MKKSKKIAALVLSAFSFAQPAFQSCYAMFNDEDQSMLQLEGKEAQIRKDFLECVQSIVSDENINTSSAIYGDFKEKAEPFKGLQFDHKPWQELLYIIEDNLESRDHERYLNAKKKSEESGEKLTFDDHLHNELLSYGFAKYEIKIVDKLLNKARDLYLKEKQDLKRKEAQIRKDFLDCLQDIISDESVNISSAIYEAFKEKAEPFKDLQSDRELRQELLCLIEDCLKPEGHDYYLCAKRKSEESGEKLTFDDHLHNELLCYGFIEDEIKIVDKLLNKARDLYLKEKLASEEEHRRYWEKRKRLHEEARQFIVDCIKKLLAMENITSISILGHLQDIAYNVATAPLCAELKHVYENFPKISKFWDEGSLGKITGEAFKELKALWEEYRKIQAEEKDKKEAEEEAKKEAEEEAKAKAEEKARYEAEWKAIQFIVDRIQELPATENITSKSILENLKAIARKQEIAPLRRDLYYVCDNFPKISEFWEEGSLGKITGEAFKELKALWEKYRKIQAEEKAKKEAEEKAEEKARKEAEEKAKKEAEEKARKEAEEKAKAGQELARRLKNFKRNQNTPLSEFKKFVDTICRDLNSKHPTFWMELSTLQSWLTNDYFDSSYDFDFELYFGFNSDLCGAVKKFVGEAKARQNTERRKEIKKRADRSIEAKEAARRGRKGGGRKGGGRKGGGRKK